MKNIYSKPEAERIVFCYNTQIHAGSGPVFLSDSGCIDFGWDKAAARCSEYNGTWAAKDACPPKY